MIVLDTSAAIELLCGSGVGRRIRELTADDEIVITAHTVHELLLGEDDAVVEFIRNTRVLPYDGDAAAASARIERELSRKGRMVNRMDILIAGVCAAQKARILAVDNDFDRIPGINATVIGMKT
jgi:predicted nucleic acid-binding protein